MNNINKLTIEQEFKLTVYKQKIKILHENQLKKHLVILLKQMIIKDNLIKYFIKYDI
uniref:Uncharacterized protein ycf18 n=1 Tax=Pterothamnion crispum TaxID=1550583 RepID=A0A4D6WXU0_9FLOR|nr:gbilisome degradation protein [Pterothamnion crispum]